MGISGLLPLLKSIQQQKHLSELSGKTLAVDAYVWLHKGAYGCAVELVTGKATTKSVTSTVILLFDTLSDREVGDKG
jgi:exonuclease-1